MNPRARLYGAALIGTGAVAWSAFAWLVMPPLLRAAYAGHGLSALVAALEYRQSYPLEHFLAKWNAIGLAVLAAWLGGGALLLTTSTRRFARRVAGTATPG